MYLILVTILVIVFAVTGMGVRAQQAPDPVFLQHAITAVQTQRNLAMDAQAVSDAKLAALTEELTKAKARIKELEFKPVEKKD